MIHTRTLFRAQALRNKVHILGKENFVENESIFAHPDIQGVSADSRDRERCRKIFSGSVQIHRRLGPHPACIRPETHPVGSGYCDSIEPNMNGVRISAWGVSPHPDIIGSRIRHFDLILEFRAFGGVACVVAFSRFRGRIITRARVA